VIALRACSVIVVLLASLPAWADRLEVGSRAPEFALAGSDGREHSLAELLGKRGLVLAWFPRAFTPG
jgi:peroxiredoxin Q/BCP